MANVYAKIQRLKRDPIKILIGGKSLFDFDPPKSSDCVLYDPNTLLDENEWYKIVDFSQQLFFPDFLKNEFISADFTAVNKSEFSKISFLISEEGDSLSFLRVRKSSFVRRKILVFGKVATVEESAPRIPIGKHPDAIYSPSEDLLLFRSLPSITAIFPGIGDLYKEATNEQVSEFFDFDFVQVEGLLPETVTKPNRKRIALCLDSLDSFNEDRTDKLLEYLENYYPTAITIEKEKKKVVVSSEEELKILLWGIDERYYTTEISSAPRIANSVIDITSP